ncbi:DUF305 domain-containing protein [Nonomuraea aurantiaca]|uniref:DUF305 domain-containing protein n=1 Tax=Nonomuraea aurantiaca TaxID=2878562 RepID=UPI001CDA0357|nr:DUF305 domain-containing protein [Nonomuraea aurantiaca]MCA2222499.1 DUF305 domain-containing protein [Nonomuraea aurantiaca]
MITKPAGVSLAAGALVLAACGSMTAGRSASALPDAVPAAATPTSTQPGAGFNDADVMFAQMMIPHHQQAVEMADLAETRASDREVKELAAKIKAAQDPEIQTMRGWLAEWGKPLPTGGMDQGMGHEMPGMMSAADMKKLEDAKGAAFDQEFLQMMIAHHNGAITMARTEREHGKNQEAKRLADAIETGQQAEVEQMRKMLDRLH